MHTLSISGSVLFAAIVLVSAQDYNRGQYSEDNQEAAPVATRYSGNEYQGGGSARYQGGGNTYMTPRSEPCQCFKCDGDGLVEPAPNMCLGPSEACSVDQSGGCFGEDSMGTGGTCQCHTSVMSDPENHVIGGIVSGLGPHDQLVVGSEWVGKGAKKGDATQTIVVRANGAFQFPLKLKSNQHYQVAVVQNPRMKDCYVDNGTGQASGTKTSVTITCSGKNEELNAEGCTCVKCNGGGLVPNYAFCSGQSIGCTVGNGMNNGCFGENFNGVTGRCSCGSGKFDNPEIYKVSGSVFGLAPGQVLILGAATGTGMHTSGKDVESVPGGQPAVQTIVLQQDGAFSFPYKLASGQEWQVQVINNPVSQSCMLERFGRSGIAGKQMEGALAVTCTAKGGLGTQSAAYRRIEAVKDAEYTGHTASLADVSDGGMYGFLFIVGVVGAAGYVQQYPDTLDQLGFKDTTIPTI